MPINPMPSVEALADISMRAGLAILRVRDLGFSKSGKADGSPVTDADLASNQLITSELKALFPHIPIVSEEGDQSKSGGIFFLVDPLDGTKEFINGSPDFTVNIALIENERPLVGVVHLPMTGTSYLGNPEGARKTQGDESRPIAVSARQQNLRVVASRSHLDIETERFIKDLKGAETVKAGSSVKFCLIAEGEAEVYPRFGRTMEWDTAAGQAVLEAAGGRVSDWASGRDFSYGKLGYENPSFVAVSNTSILQQ